MFHAKSSAHDWKKKLGKYLRLKASEAREFKLISKTDKMNETEEVGSDDDSEVSEDVNLEREWANDQDAMDDITGYHFVDIPGLFVAYAYVTSAAKVLESREVTRQLHKMPDFEEVYHLVIDAVDTYNEAWENEYRNTVTGRDTKNTADGDSLYSSREGSNVHSKKQIYMSAVRFVVTVVEILTYTFVRTLQTQIKEELLEKQRVEMAIKQVS